MISIKEKPYYKTTIESVIGEITLGSDGENLVGLWTDGQRYFGDTVPNEMLPNDNLNIFAITKDWLNRYFEGKKPQISELPLAPIGGRVSPNCVENADRNSLWESNHIRRACSKNRKATRN